MHSSDLKVFCYMDTLEYSFILEMVCIFTSNLLIKVFCSGMLVQDPSKANDVDSIFNQARQHAAVEGPPASSGSRSFTGTARRLTGETVSAAPQPPESVTHTITFWTNGFTIDDGPLRRFDDPENAPFLEVISVTSLSFEMLPVVFHLSCSTFTRHVILLSGVNKTSFR